MGCITGMPLLCATFYYNVISRSLFLHDTDKYGKQMKLITSELATNYPLYKTNVTKTSKGGVIRLIRTQLNNILQTKYPISYLAITYQGMTIFKFLVDIC